MTRSAGSLQLRATLLAVSLAGIGSNAPAQRVSARDLVDSVAAREVAFLTRWASALVQSRPRLRPRPEIVTAPIDPALTRQQLMELRFGRAPWCGATAWHGNPATGAEIMDGPTGFRYCTRTLTPATAVLGDERVWRDAFLLETARNAVRQDREELLAFLERVAAIAPANDFVVGRRIKYLVDQREFTRGIAVARECEGTPDWCASLLGFALAASGAIAEADSVFGATAAQVPGDRRCTDPHFPLLLDPSSARTYARLPCDERLAFQERFWWLADPMLSTPGNERRVEHHVRRVLVALGRSLGIDEYFDWRTATAGGSAAELLIRYGWPSTSSTAGAVNDRAWLDGHVATPGRGIGAGPSPRLREMVYGGPRLGFAVSADRFPAIFTTTMADWAIDADRPLHAPWPRETMALATPLVSFPSVQAAVFRRNTGAWLAVATPLDARHLRRATGTPVADIALAVSGAPNSVRILGRRGGVVGSSVALNGAIDSVPILVALELPGEPRTQRPAARIRFGITPSPPLSRLGRDTFDVSLPVLLHRADTAPALPIRFDSLLSMMGGTLTIPRSMNAGVYWETYGLAPDTPVDLGIWMQRATGQSIPRRISNVLGVTADQNTPVVSTWTERIASSGSVIESGPVPVIARRVAIDLSRLPAGAYWLEVAAAPAGNTPIRRRVLVHLE